jgi:hypothetical protein
VIQEDVRSCRQVDCGGFGIEALALGHFGGLARAAHDVVEARNICRN